MALVIEAVLYLHQQKSPIVHGDIKPANIIMQNEDSAPVLVGLGLVRACDSSQLRDGDRFHYKAPEQYGGSIDVRSDVYALGATFYTLATASCHRVHKSRDAPKCDKNRRLKKIRRPRSHESKSDQEQIVPVRQLPLTILAIRRTFEDYIA